MKLKFKKLLIFFIVSVLLPVFGGCAPIAQNESGFYSFTDDSGHIVKLDSKPERVVALMGSYGELWMLAGGAVTGITEDAVSERNLKLSEDVSIIGTVKNPNPELILSLSPDFVLLSTDIASHVKLDETLDSLGISHAYFKVDSVDEYLNMLKICTEINGAEELYTKYGADVEARVRAAIDKADSMSSGKRPKILLIRSMSTKAKALKEDHPIGKVLKDLNAENIASKYPSLLEDLSLETIITEDPDFIFVLPMGDEEKAMETLTKGVMSNPAWSGLSAVKNNRFFVLPKEQFQYKPNANWGYVYEYLEEILYEAED